MLLVGVAWTLVVTVSLSLPPTLAPAVVGLGAFGVYASDRITDVDADELSDPARVAFVRRHRRPLSILSAAAYGLAVTLAVVGGPLALGITLLPGVVWVCYATDWMPWLVPGIRRLKQVVVINTTLVAGAWAVGVVLLPVAFADRPLSPAVWVLFAYAFVDVFVNTEIPNVPDRQADAAVGVSTLPVVLGVTRTRQVLYLLEALLSVVLIGALVGGVLPMEVGIATLWAAGFTVASTAVVGRTDHYRRLTVAGELKQLGVAAILLVLQVTGV